MASDLERLTDDTDDTASVARSDDTAASEPGGTGDDPWVPPVAAFRPIQPEMPRMSLAVPASPTRGPDSHSNVTGRGGAKADYKRRTLEFVGALNKPSKYWRGLKRYSFVDPKMLDFIAGCTGIPLIPNYLSCFRCITSP